MLKKITVFMLVIAMALTALNTYADSEESTAEIYSINFFETLGIIDGEDEYQLRLDDKMTRAEFAVLIAGLLKNSGYAGTGQVFADVPMEHKAANAINMLAHRGFISGVGGGMFAPDRAIEYTEALSIVLKLLGYGDFVKIGGGYPMGCYWTAQKFKLFSSVNLNAESTVLNIFELLYEAVQENLMDISLVGDNYKTQEVNTGETFLSVYFDIYSVKGTLTSDGIVDIKSTELPMRDEIKVDGISYKSESNYSELLGQNVICFYKESDMIDKTVVYMAPTNKNKVLLIDSEDVYAFDGAKLEYEKENGKSAEISITGDMDIIYNNTVVTELTSSVMLPDDGYIRMIDNDRDNKYDVIIIKSYVSFVINYVHETENGVTINARDAVTTDRFNVIKDGEQDTLIYNKDMKMMSLSDIKTGMVASVAAVSENGVYTAKEIILCDDELFGDLKGSKTKNGDLMFLVDSEYHNVTKIYEPLAQKVGTRIGVTFYLDFFGDIVDIVETDMSELDVALGYVIKVGHEVEGLKDEIRIKIFSEVGKMVVYELNENVIIDGVRYKGSANILAALGGENMSPQLISYKLAENRKINYIDRAASQSGAISSDYYNRLTETHAHSNATSGLYYQTGQRSFQGKITVDDSTKVFVIPTGDVTTAEEKLFEIRKTSQLQTGSELYKDIAAYSVNNDRVPADALVIKATTGDMPSTSVAMAVKEISNAINSEGDETYELTLVGMNGEESYTAIDKSVAENGGGKVVSVGDIVRIDTDKDGYIKKLVQLYDYETGAVVSNSAVVGGNFFTTTRVVKADVYRILNGYMQIADYGFLNTLSAGSQVDMTNLENQNLAKFSVVVYDIVAGQLRIAKGSMNDMVGYTNNKNEYSQIVMYSASGVEKIVFVLPR